MEWSNKVGIILDISKRKITLITIFKGDNNAENKKIILKTNDRR